MNCLYQPTGKTQGDKHEHRCSQCGHVRWSKYDDSELLHRRCDKAKHEPETGLQEYESPGLVQKVVKWGKAIQRWRAAGSPVRSEEEVDRINVICRACEHYNQKRQRCKLCGCYCRKKGMAEFNKPKMATEKFIPLMVLEQIYQVLMRFHKTVTNPGY